MKHLTIILLTLLMSMGAWADDESFDSTDDICVLSGYFDNGSMQDHHRGWIRDYCKKNDILWFISVDPDYVAGIISEFCRYDRNVHEHLIDDSLVLTCVLHNNEPRKQVDPLRNP